MPEWLLDIPEHAYTSSPAGFPPLASKTLVNSQMLEASIRWAKHQTDAYKVLKSDAAKFEARILTWCKTYCFKAS